MRCVRFEPEMPNEPTLKSISVVGVKDQVLSVLRAAIWSGSFAPGERLNEQRLCDQLEISRPPIREALQVLNSEGLTVSQPNRSTYVRTFGPIEFAQLLDVRFALESLAARRLIGSGGLAQPELGLLRTALADIPAQPDLVASIRSSLNFRRVLVDAVGSGQLTMTWWPLFSCSMAAVNALGSTTALPSMHDSELLDAITKLDLSAAAMAVGDLSEWAAFTDIERPGPRTT